MSMQWVRLWHDMPTDPKWRVIARKSGQTIPSVIAVYTMMMVNASEAPADERGCLSGFDSEDVAAALDMLPDDVDAILDAMQGKVLDGRRLSGWSKRQPKRERDDNSTDRVRAHRQRQKANETPCNATERHVTPPEEDTDTDTDTEEEYKGAYAFDGRIVRLNQSDFDRWQKSYDCLDLKACLQSRDDWLVTQPEPERKRWFNSTSNWLAKKQQEAKNGTGIRTGRANRAGSSFQQAIDEARANLGGT